MEEEKKNADFHNQGTSVVSKEEFLEEVSHDTERRTTQNVVEDNDEVTPTIIKKLHRRQVSTASAKMFAINEDVFMREESNSFAPKNDIPQNNVESSHTDQNSKEVKFENIKGDSGISRSVDRSDIDQTSDTQITSGLGTIETGFETTGTSRSSINRGKHTNVAYTKLKGKLLIGLSIKSIY